jgi:hypothetical protein
LSGNGSGFGNESSLHSSVKSWISRPGDRFEVWVDGFVVDIVRNDLLIEVQTSNFSAIKNKLWSLVEDHNLRLVHPIARRKWIVRVAEPSSRVVSRRRSPKKGKLTDLFDELIWVPDLVDEDNFSLEVLMVEEEEIRCNDGRGSWRRKGVSIKDHKLLDVYENVTFTTREDFRRFLPIDLPQPFSNNSLAETLGISVRQARRMTYCLRKMGVIQVVGKNGKALLFETSM